MSVGQCISWRLDMRGSNGMTGKARRGKLGACELTPSSKQTCRSSLCARPHMLPRRCGFPDRYRAFPCVRPYHVKLWH